MFDTFAKYNFWSGEAIRTGLDRPAYVGKLVDHLGNSLIKVVLGQRRSGKSYVLRMLIRQMIEQQQVEPANIFYVNKDMQELDFIDSSTALLELIEEYHRRLQPRGKVFVLLDEVQEIENWERAVNSLSQDYRREYELVITGSNAKLLSSELATYLSGRYVTLDVYPFSYSEFLTHSHETRSKDSFLRYLSMGGLPELYNLEGPEIRRNYVSSLRDSIVLRDVVQRHQVRDVALLNRLIDFMIDSAGAMFSPNRIVNTLAAHGVKTSLETLSAYLDFLREAYFLHEVPRYDLRGRRMLAGERKYYLNDVGFRAYLTSGENPSLGRLLENLVFLHYKRQGYSVYTGRIGESEIDFVLKRGKETQYVQVCYLLADDAVMNREFGNLERIRDNFPKTVVSLDDIALGQLRGIHHLRAWEL